MNLSFIHRAIRFLKLILVGLIGACNFSLSDQEVAKMYTGRTPPRFFVRIENEPGARGKGERNAPTTLHYAQVGSGKLPFAAQIPPPALPTLVFVHGSPGSWSNFADYLSSSQLASRATLMISVDRLGFGKSSSERSEANLTKQAQAIAPLLEELEKNQGGFVLVGHSYGGAVIARLALMFPEWVRGLIFLASSFHAPSEETYWYNYLANLFFVRPFLSRDLRHSNDEILALKKQLESLQPLWQQWGSFSIPVLAIHGKKDRLVPLAHTLFLERLVRKHNTAGEFYFPSEMGHFFIWNQKDYVLEKIVSFLDTLEKGAGNADH